MSEFHVTESMAEERIEQLLNAAEALSISPSFVELEDYLPGLKADFERYISDFGIEYFSIEEITRPHRPAKARQAGYEHFVPPIHLWPWALLALRMGDLMREEAGSPVRLRNLYRPMSYNRLVAESDLDSDHPNACGGDFDFGSSSDRRAAEQLVRDLSKNHPELELSLGMGKRTLHVGVMSPKGKRSWFYKDYPDSRVRLA